MLAYILLDWHVFNTAWVFQFCGIKRHPTNSSKPLMTRVSVQHFCATSRSCNTAATANLKLRHEVLLYRAYHTAVARTL